MKASAPSMTSAIPTVTGTESNAHGLFGTLVVEPEGAWWTDPEAGHDTRVDDCLYVDVHLSSPEAGPVSLISKGDTMKAP